MGPYHTAMRLSTGPMQQPDESTTSSSRRQELSGFVRFFLIDERSSYAGSASAFFSFLRKMFRLMGLRRSMNTMPFK